MSSIQTYQKKYNTFAASLLKHYAASEQTGGNIVVSPFSILLLLCIAADATDGMTRKEIADVISDGRSFEEIREFMRNLSGRLTESSALTSANAVCVKKECPHLIRPEYAETLKDYFQGRLFASSDIVRDVNAWVCEKTNGMIRELADDSFKMMDLCLMNAVSFESEWKEQYEDSDIFTEVFTDFTGTMREVTMLESRELQYIENTDFTGFVKPYKDGDYSFMALLPVEKSRRFLIDAAARTHLSDLFLSQTQEEVFVSIPEFKYSFETDLTAFCKKAGIHQMFTEKADFSPMAAEEMMADSILHKACIEVDRKGTKAVAATAVFTDITGFSPFKSVYLDRPFVFAIMHNETALPVFAGIFTDPGEQCPEYHDE